MLPMPRRWCSNFTWICEVKIFIEIQCKHILSCPVSLSINVASPNEFLPWYCFSQQSRQSLFWYRHNISTLGSQ